jgi:hypothetical protein
MYRKRLQNVADNLCQIFCGWRQMKSKPMLVELGSGILEIDVLTGQCMFEDKLTVQLPIAVELSSWMQKELSSQQIPTSAIRRARLVATLLFTQIPWNAQTKEVFLSHGNPVRSERMHRCTFDCESEIATDERIYQSRMREVQEWPLGWPEDGET